MRVMAIDFGTKRIGVAISDEEGKIAFPKEVIQNNTSTVEKVKAFAKESGIKTIVIGESKDFGGRENALMKHIRAFSKEMESGYAIVFEPEYSSSVEAGRFQGVNEMHDASAAAIILQRYLDKQQKQ